MSHCSKHTHWCTVFYPATESWQYLQFRINVWLTVENITPENVKCPTDLFFSDTVEILVLSALWKQKLSLCACQVRHSEQKNIKRKTYLFLSLECGKVSITTWRNQCLLASHLPTSCLPLGRSPSSWRRSWLLTRRYRQEEPSTTTIWAPDKAYNTQRHSPLWHHYNPNSTSTASKLIWEYLLDDRFS